MSRADPRKACANEQQRLFWALVHDGLAHPLMALTGYCKPAMRFHDWTSHKAWPRAEPAPYVSVGQAVQQLRRGQPFSVVTMSLSRDLIDRIAAKKRHGKCAFCLTAEPHYHANGQIYYIYKLEDLT
jgi:hypothetical protein